MAVIFEHEQHKSDYFIFLIKSTNCSGGVQIDCLNVTEFRTIPMK